MLNILFTLAALLSSLQASNQMVVGRLYVNTPYDTSIIYSYAGAAFLEGEPIKEGAVECFTSELKATGLFTDVQVILKSTENSRTVDVIVEPTWNPRKDYFTISEVVLDGITGVDEKELRTKLKQKGLTAGAPLPQAPLSAAGTAVAETVHETYQTDLEKESDVSEKLINLPYKLELASPEKVKLIVSSSSTPPCHQ